MPSFAIPQFTVLLEPLWVSAVFLLLSTGPNLDGTISGLLQQPQDQGKAEGLAACNSQTASPFGCLNNFYCKILSNFWGSLHLRVRLFFARWSHRVRGSEAANKIQSVFCGGVYAAKNTLRWPRPKGTGLGRPDG